jgi:hypothetical protein
MLMSDAFQRNFSAVLQATYRMPHTCSCACQSTSCLFKSFEDDSTVMTCRISFAGSAQGGSVSNDGSTGSGLLHLLKG